MPRPKPSCWSLSLISLRDFLPKLRYFEHFGFRLHGELANGRDVRVVQAVRGAHGEFDLVHAHVEELLEAGVFLADLFRSFVELHLAVVEADEHVEVVAQDGREPAVRASSGVMRPSVQTSRMSLS